MNVSSRQGVVLAEAAEVVDAVPAGSHLIGGEWVRAAGGETVAVLDPATGGEIARVPRGGAGDVDDAVRAAAAAFPSWRDTSPAQRAALLRRWADLCVERGAELGRLEALEVGQPYRRPSAVGQRLGYVAGLADKLGGRSLPTINPDTLAFTLREPFGVCGCIVPWNAPGPLMTEAVGPALAAGNVVVAKPASEAPLTCLLIGKLALEAGLPAGAFNLVTGPGSVTGPALAEHPLVRHMSFTGSTETGAQVAEACARNVIPVHLELGGKSPQVVFADADLRLAARNIVRGIVVNSGQTCAAGTRVLAERGIRDQLVAMLGAGMATVKVGAWNEEAEMGPLISDGQRRQVIGHIEDARAEGAELVVGGGRPRGERFDQGFFVAPTLFDGVEPGMRIACEEVFGPVLSVIEFDGLEEAVEIANGTPYGLVATAWTADVGRAVRMARRLEAGQVHVNVGRPGGAIGAPFGGYKQSGYGRTMSAETIEEFTQVKTVVIGGHEGSSATSSDRGDGSD